MAKELLPPVLISTPEWGQRYFRLPDESGSTRGSYDLDYTPYLWGIFAALDDPVIPEIAVQKAAQIGWTYGLIVYLGRRIDNDPCPIVLLFAAEEAAREFVDEKLVPSVNATPRLAARVDVSSSRTSGNRALFKKFPGGFLKLGGSRSIFKVKSTPAPVVIVEEPDDTQDDLARQGNAIRLLWERTKRQRAPKRLLGGTPSVAGLSKVEEHIDQSDKRVLPITCNDCGERHVLDFEHVTWDGKGMDPEHPDLAHKPPHPVYGKQSPESAVYCCPHCGSLWDDHTRKENIKATVAAAIEAGDPYYGWVPTAPYHGVAGFMELNELYSCLPGVGLAEMVQDYLQSEAKAAQGDESAKIVFINSKLARTYEYKGDQLDADALREFAEDYPIGTVPMGGLLLTVGVDVQGDRLAVVVRAWGRGHESWLVYWGELYAATGTHLQNDPVWKELDALVFGAFPHATGGQLHVAAISIDSSDGNTSDAVYWWVRTRQAAHRRVQVMAIKGSSARDDPEIFRPPSNAPVDHTNAKRRTKADRHGIKPYIVGTSKAKDWIHRRIAPTADGAPRALERFHHSEHARADYWEQMTAEVKAPHRTTGRLMWQPRSGRAHEAWDCEVYALHAARAVRVHLMRPGQWDVMEGKLRQPDLLGDQGEPSAGDETGVSPETVTEQPQAERRFKVKRKRR